MANRDSRAELYRRLLPLLDSPLPARPDGTVLSYCPGHDDGKKHGRKGSGVAGRSLGLHPERGLTCFAGCTKSDGFDRVVRLLQAHSNAGPDDSTRTTVYDIRNVDGQLQAQHVRIDRPSGKEMLWKSADGSFGLKGRTVASLPLYRSEELARWIEGTAVIVVEGEKATDALRAAGFSAVGTVGGSGVLPNDASLLPLLSFRIMLWPDNDPAGESHMRQIGTRLTELGCDVSVLHWKDAPPKGDAADFLFNHSSEDLAEVIATSLPWRVFVNHASQDTSDNLPLPPAEGPWGKLVRLPSADHEAVPTMPEEMIPIALRQFTLDIANGASLPIEMAAIPVVVSLASVVGRGYRIRPDRFDDWEVVPNLWGALVAPPGSLKSAVLQKALHPIRKLEIEAARKFERESSEFAIKEQVLSARMDKAKVELKAKTAKGEPTQDVESEMLECAMTREEATPKRRRFITSDATVEKLGEILRENSRGVLVYRDELAGWMATFDRAGREGDREFYLEAWNGNGSYTVDRIGRGTLHIEGLALSIIGGIQPAKLKPLVRNAIAGQKDADGLLQRFQLIVLPDSLGDWRPSLKPASTTAASAIYDLFASLAGITEQPSGDRQPDSHYLARFSQPAQERFDAWRAALERRLRDGTLEGTPAFAAHIAKYRSLVPTLALLFHLVSHPTRMEDERVGLEDLELALRWADFLEAHARKLYRDEFKVIPSAATLLATKIATGEVLDGDTISEIGRHHWSGLKTSQEVTAAADALGPFNWVRIEKIPSDGGRPSYVIRLHPDLRG